MRAVWACLTALMMAGAALAQQGLPPRPGPIQPTSLEHQQTAGGFWVYLLGGVVLALVLLVVYVALARTGKIGAHGQGPDLRD